ncbi:MAG: hypothetical protein WC869_08505 [Phycisphaerae bacterium]|jgi:hypothetical protein
MSQPLQDALESLRSIGTVEELRGLAGRGLAPAGEVRVNAHIHLPPNFSAFETVAQAIDLAAAQRIGVLGASNYYDFSVYADFTARARAARIFPLYGLEIISLIDELVRDKVKINDPGNPGRMYLCGKGITCFARPSEAAQGLIALIRQNDTQRMEAMARLLGDIFAEHGVQTNLSAAAIVDRVVARHHCSRQTVCLQERHLAQAFQEVFFEQIPPDRRAEMLGRIFGAASTAGPSDGPKVQNEIRTHLMKAGKKAFVAETFLNFAQAYSLILELGGIPCYPTLADGASPICTYEEPVEKLIDSIRGNGIYCAELIPIRNKPEVLVHYATAMRRAGIVLMGGTEHNTLDLLPIEPACIGGAPVPAEIKHLFWEGACVAAAHQFLRLHGQCGFVDAQGRKNDAYRSDEERIAAFSRLGAAVIQRYYETI